MAGFRDDGDEFLSSAKGGVFSNRRSITSFAMKMVYHKVTSSYPCFLSSKQRYNQFHRKASMGRLKQRYEDDFKMDVSRMGMKDVNWIEVAEDKIQHRALVLGVLNEFSNKRGIS
jgi:hypothetical protein